VVGFGVIGCGLLPPMLALGGRRRAEARSPGSPRRRAFGRTMLYAFTIDAGRPALNARSSTMAPLRPAPALPSANLAIGDLVGQRNRRTVYVISLLLWSKPTAASRELAAASPLRAPSRPASTETNMPGPPACRPELSNLRGARESCPLAMSIGLLPKCRSCLHGTGFPVAGQTVSGPGMPDAPPSRPRLA